MRVTGLVVALLSAASPALAQSSPSGPTERGSVLVSGAASFTHSKESDGGGSTTIASLQPNVLFFLAPRLAVGGQLGLSYLDFDGGKGTSWLIGPAARIYFGPSSSRTLPFIGIAALKGSTTIESDDTPGERESETWSVEGLAGLTFMLSRQVGITGEAFIGRSEDSFDTGPFGEAEAKRTGFGLRFGIAAFLF